MLITALNLSYTSAAWTLADANNANTVSTAQYFPTIAATPLLGLTGSAIVITGSGFAPSSNLTATFDGNATPWTANGGTETSSTSGAIPALASIAAGSQPAGTYPITVTDAHGDSATTSYVLLN